MHTISTFLYTKYSTYVLLFCCILFSACTQPDPVHILFAGDMMLDRGTRKAIDKAGVSDLFAGVQDVFAQQDIVLVNLEQPVCSPMLKAMDKIYCFRADPDWLPVVRQCGITHVALANNHSGDYGKEGLRQTMQYLLRKDIAYTGADSTFHKPCEPLLIRKKGAKLAVFSTTTLYQQNPSGCCNESSSELQNRLTAFKKNIRIIVLLCVCIGELKCRNCLLQINVHRHICWLMQERT